jgi:hypothetical protein
MNKQRPFDLKSVLRKHAHELAWAVALTGIAIVALIASGFRFS